MAVNQIVVDVPKWWTKTAIHSRAASMATNVKFAKVKQAFLNQWKINPVGQENQMRLERRLGNYGLVKRNITNFSVPVSKAKHSFKHPVCPEIEM